jgi:hypothetical protein
LFLNSTIYFQSAAARANGMLFPNLHKALFVMGKLKTDLMKLLTLIFLTSFIISCNNQTQEQTVVSKTENLQGRHQDSTFSAEIIRNINDTSISNSTDNTIDILFNGAANYLGGQRNPKMNFTTECMVCEPVQVYKQGFLFGKRLYITKDSVIIYQSDRDISDTSAMIKMKGYDGERKAKKYKFSGGSLTMKYQGQSCNDADFVSVKLSYDKGAINFNNLINASLFEYDLDKNGINEQYLLGTRNCSQELVLLRVNDTSN